MLRVLIDARKIEHGGIGTYIRNLLTGLLKTRQVTPLIILPSGCKGKYFSSSELQQIEQDSRPYSLDEYLGLAYRVKKLCSFDVFHSPHFVLPLGITAPTVVTVHDTIHLSCPERWFYPLVARRLIGSALKRCTRVITVSQASRQEILSHFHGIKQLAEKIDVVANAVSPDFLQGHLQTDAGRSLQSLPAQDFILAIFSQCKPHKGLFDLLDAYNLAKKTSCLPPLVIAGQGVKRFIDNFPKQLATLETANVYPLGEVSQQDLKSLYRAARVTVVPSLIEGFGLTALEAKVLGCPLILRPLPSIIEFTDKQDRICQNMSIQALAEELAGVTANFPAERAEVLNLELAEKYSIEQLAIRTAFVYQQSFNQRVRPSDNLHQGLQQ